MPPADWLLGTSLRPNQLPSFCLHAASFVVEGCRLAVWLDDIIIRVGAIFVVTNLLYERIISYIEGVFIMSSSMNSIGKLFSAVFSFTK